MASQKAKTIVDIVITALSDRSELDRWWDEIPEHIRAAVQAELADMVQEELDKK